MKPFATLAIVVLAVIACITLYATVQASSIPQDFIAASPINVSQIRQISKFRSCVGHDYSAHDVNGSLETDRSMKHYFAPLPMYNGTTNAVQEFAPFNGTVASMVSEEHPYGKQVWVAYGSDYLPLLSGNTLLPQPGIWYVVFFHTNPLPGISVGSKVHVGELIGYANLTANEQLTFDITAVQFSLSKGGQVLDSIFSHMSQSVLAEFASHGVTPSNIIIPKSYRDANPCVFNNQYPSPNDSVTLSQ